MPSLVPGATLVMDHAQKIASGLAWSASGHLLLANGEMTGHSEERSTEKTEC